MNIIHIRNKSGYKTEIDTRGHLFLADEPIDTGGTDTAASPYEMFLSSLGSCKAITMRMYAQRKNYKLDEIEIELSHQKINAEDCADCETKAGTIDKIDIKVRFKGELNDDEIKRLLEISERCPVQKTVMSEVKINTNIFS
ncbi:MAG: OsmC family protein [Bacteroidetes bacterium]|nr:OsmC family protein [Bacteroidota bacterium]